MTCYKCRNKHRFYALISTAFIVVFLYLSSLIIACPIRAVHIQSDIIESDTINTILEYLPKNISSKTNNEYLVLFDIDNTLAEPIDPQKGSDQWFYAKVALYQKKGRTKEDAINQTVNELFAMQDSIKLKAIEADAASILSRLQENQFTIIALTARACLLIESTIKKLAEIGINFSHKSRFNNNFSFCATEPACYKSGILFTGPNDKGIVLEKWLNKEKFLPKKILFIDDKLANLTAVQRAAQKLSIPFIGIRYNRLDEKIRSFKLEEYEGSLLPTKRLRKRIVQRPMLIS